MKIAPKCITIISSLSLMIGVQGTSTSTSSMSLNADPLRSALCKIAPLEKWGASWSSLGPKVCWKLFRPNPEQLDRLLHAINSFEGHTRWYIVDDCLQPGAVVTSLPERVPLRSSITPPAIQVSQEEANSDLAALASEIERRLNLHGVQLKPFSETLLTKEGLRRLHGPFDDFEEGGQRTAYLIANPAAWGTSQPTETDVTNADIMLHFEPGYEEMTAIFGDIVGADLTQRNGQTLTDAETEKIERAFPILWKVSEYYEDAYLNPEEAAALSQECAAMDRIVSSPKAIRGLDKLFRIARWASEKHYGVLFSAP